MLFARRCFASAALAYAPLLLNAQSSAAPPQAPAWAQPGSATHTQVAPPPNFHRSARNFPGRIGIFDGQADVGAAFSFLLPSGAAPQADFVLRHSSVSVCVSASSTTAEFFVNPCSRIAVRCSSKK